MFKQHVDVREQKAGNENHAIASVLRRQNYFQGHSHTKPRHSESHRCTQIVGHVLCIKRSRHCQIIPGKMDNMGAANIRQTLEHPYRLKTNVS